jgi:hypothetical protein
MKNNQTKNEELCKYDSVRKKYLSAIELKAKNLLDQYYFGSDFSKINVNIKELNNVEVED